MSRPLNRARRASWKASRVIGDIEAAERGPGAYGRRIIRRHVTRHTNRALRGAMRRLGL